MKNKDTILRMIAFAIQTAIQNEKYYGESAEWVSIPKCQAQEIIRVICQEIKLSNKK
jgi:hypothetical protein